MLLHTIKKSILFLAIGAACVCIGCRSSEIAHTTCGYQNESKNCSSFNTEKYVWENFYFSTNEVQKTIK